MLTPAQKATVKAYIAADPVLSQIPATNEGNQQIADALNAEKAPAFVVWKTSVPVLEIEQNGFAWNQLDSVPAAKYRIWERLCSYATINPSKTNVRQGINDFCKDNSNQVLTALRDSIFPHLKRNVTVAESLFATGTGTDATPGTLGSFEGQLSYVDVEEARNS